jgi:hypothetical protein
MSPLVVTPAMVGRLSRQHEQVLAAGRRVMVESLALSDCERLRDGWVSQPANAVSSLAYVGAGLVLLRWAQAQASLHQGSALPIATGMVTAGLGSLDYHGFQSPRAQWGHDWGVAAPVVAAIHTDAGELLPEVPSRLRAVSSVAALAAVGILLAHRPRSGPVVGGVGAVVLVMSEIELWRRGRRPAPHPRSKALLKVAAGAGVAGVTALAMSRSGGPWCRPDSLLQGHAVWHACSAMALLCWAMAVLPDVDAAGAPA